MTEDEAHTEVPPGAPEPPPPSRRENLAVVVMLAAVALAGIALLGPWATVTTTGSGGPSFADVRDYGVGGWSGTGTAAGVSVTPSGGYVSWPSVAAVFVAVEVTTVLAAVLGGVAFILGLGPSARVRVRRAAVLLGIGAGMLAFAGPVLFAAVFPGAATSASILPGGAGLWGSGNATVGTLGSSRTWAAGWAWYDLLVAGALFVAASWGLRPSRNS